MQKGADPAGVTVKVVSKNILILVAPIFIGGCGPGHRGLYENKECGM